MSVPMEEWREQADPPERNDRSGYRMARRSVLIGAMGVLAACGARQKRGTPPPRGAKWQDILAAGRKEGRVLMYGGVVNSAHVARIARDFEAETGIAFDFLPISGPAAMTRVREELKVGIAPDIVESSGGWLHQLYQDRLLLPLRDIALPVWAEPADIWNIDPGYKSPGREFVLSRLRVRQGHLGINSKLLAARGIPRNWQELGENPAFRSSLVLLDPSRSTSATAEFVIQHYIGKAMQPRDLWNIMAAQDPMLILVPRANVISVAQGERSLTFPPIDETVINLVEAGAPVRNIYFADAPVFAETADMGVLAQCAHPNAAIVFINWYLGRAGQALLGELLHQTSLRRDVPSTVPLALRGTVVGGGKRGPVVVDSPMQTRLIQDIQRSGLMAHLIDGSPVTRFQQAWTEFIADWEAANGIHNQPMTVQIA